MPMRSGDGVLEVAAETGDPSMSWAGSGLSSTDRYRVALVMLYSILIANRMCIGLHFKYSGLVRQ